MASENSRFFLFKKGLEKEGKVEYYARGKRSKVYSCMYKGFKCVAKVERADSDAVGRLENEAKWLLVLNKHDIGPKLYAHGTDFIVCEFIEGVRIVEWLSSASNKEAKKVLLGVFAQCRKMDVIGVTKEEMHHPLKHIIVSNSNARMIDFERCHVNEKPQNVTQFCQFLMSKNVYPLLSGKGIKFGKDEVIELLKAYRTDASEKNYRKIIDALSL